MGILIGMGRKDQRACFHVYESITLSLYCVGSWYAQTIAAYTSQFETTMALQMWGSKRGWDCCGEERQATTTASSVMGTGSMVGYGGLWWGTGSVIGYGVWNWVKSLWWGTGVCGEVGGSVVRYGVCGEVQGQTHLHECNSRRKRNPHHWTEFTEIGISSESRYCGVPRANALGAGVFQCPLIGGQDLVLFGADCYPLWLPFVSKDIPCFWCLHYR